MPLLSFISTIDALLDGKGRVCVPADYRAVLSARQTQGLYVCPAASEDAIDCFGADVLGAITEKLNEQDVLMSSDYDDLAAAVLPEIENLTLDETGRVRLPAYLIEMAGLKKHVKFVGIGRKFQIWDPDRYMDVRAARRKRAQTLRQRGAA